MNVQSPLRPIVSAVGSATYDLARYVNHQLMPDVRNSTSWIRNTKDFVDKLEDTCIDRDDVMISFDVKSLLTSVPVKEALKVVEDVFNEDKKEFEEQNNISRETLVEMLHVCLSAASFQFRGKQYELTDGFAMGSPVSPPVACMFMSRLDEHALATFQTRPST